MANKVLNSRQAVPGFAEGEGELGAGIKKVEIVSNIADALGIEIDNLAGLEKAPKATLKTIERVLSE